MKQRQIWSLEIQQNHWKYQQNPKCEETIGNTKKTNKTKEKAAKYSKTIGNTNKTKKTKVFT